MLDIRVIDKYLSSAVSDVQHRYRSWDHCFSAFSNSNENSKNLALHLGFYLASWGMYRGSGGLLQKNHLIHEGAVKIILSDEYRTLRCGNGNDVNEKSIPLILQIKKALSNHYKAIQFKRKNKEQPISDTDTLLSKILLGTTGCVPAWDRYFIEGLKSQGIRKCDFNQYSLQDLFQFIQSNKQQFENCQKTIKDKLGFVYPMMKLVDMYFWQIGFDSE